MGSIAVLTQTSQEIATHGNPSGLLQDVPVYKIISYHPDGTHTCLDAFGGNSGAAGTMVNSDECDPYQFNQTNQLWIIGNTEQDNSMMNSEGQTYMFTPGDPATTPSFPPMAHEQPAGQPVARRRRALRRPQLGHRERRLRSDQRVGHHQGPRPVGQLQ